jgi:molybdopterin-containing oxidoreductase family membrane subunit
MQIIKDFFTAVYNGIFVETSKNMRIALYVLFVLSLLFGIFAIQILFWGLGYTDMDNNFAWGAWIIGDLGLVALGGGAFTTGYLLYIFRVDKLKPIINSTVLIGFMCYLFTFVFLLFDLGQPLRCWFGFAYPNWVAPNSLGIYPYSMLTEVFFCLSLYFCILIV